MALLSRRPLLAGAAALAGGAGPAAPPSPGLNALARRGGRFFGSAVDAGQLASDGKLMACMAAECGMVVGENQFKWDTLHPEPNRYDFGPADALVSWAHDHAIQVRGHTLLWHKGNPDWLEAACSGPGPAEMTLRGHIQVVCGHFRDRLAHWDVVNEVIQPAAGQRGGFQDSLWFRALGPDLLDIAFSACAEADPAALRVMNEDQMDYAWAPHVRKRQAVLETLAAMRARGVAVQALGLQAHLEAGVPELDQKALADFVADVRALGLQVLVTELDVRDNRVPAPIPARDAAVAAHARAYLDAVLAGGGVLGVLTWGLTDRHTWLNQEIPRADKLPQRALPFDADLRPTPLYNAIAAAFTAAPAR
jgi:endo-1,4-beta-xylanase